MTATAERRLARAPKLQHLDPDRIADLEAPGWKRRKTLTHLDERGTETKIRVRRSTFPSAAEEMKVADIDCRFDVDGRIAGFCEMTTVCARPFSVPLDCYPEMDDHSADAGKLNLLLQTRFDEHVLEHGHIAILRRIQFLPTCRPGAWVGPFNHLLTELFIADDWAFLIGRPFPLEYEAHQQDEATPFETEVFERRQEALTRLYAGRLGFQRLRNEGEEWVWRPIGPRCTIRSIQSLIHPPDRARPLVERYEAAETDASEGVANDFDARP